MHKNSFIGICHFNYIFCYWPYANGSVLTFCIQYVSLSHSFSSKINGVLMCELNDFLCSPRVHLQRPWLLRKSKFFVFLYRLNTVSFRNYLVQDESGQGSETFVWVNNKSGLVFSSREVEWSSERSWSIENVLIDCRNVDFHI